MTDNAYLAEMPLEKIKEIILPQISQRFAKANDGLLPTEIEVYSPNFGELAGNDFLLGAKHINDPAADGFKSETIMGFRLSDVMQILAETLGAAEPGRPIFDYDLNKKFHEPNCFFKSARVKLPMKSAVPS